MEGFKKLSEVELVNEVTDEASVLIEENGEIKRTPKSNVGGNGGGKPTLFFMPYSPQKLYLANNHDYVPETFSDDSVSLEDFKEYFYNSECIVNKLNVSGKSSAIYKVAGFFPYNDDCYFIYHGTERDTVYL